ncbi:CAT RNA binding domain-containing protein [[Clostridium] innocuum]|uniref:CAT RNA binding domain-containing protein n=1 Tax=Clostridium innocuum TaxID=1522 RepID=UPI003A4D5019
MRIKRILNNNAVVSLDENENEVILLGSGIAFIENQRIIAGNAQFTGIAAGQGVGFTTGLLLLREGLGMRETPIRPQSWHRSM